MEAIGSLSIIGYVAGLFGLIAVVASAFVVYRSTETKRTIETYKELNEALTRRVEFLEKRVEYLVKEQEVLKNIPLKELSETQASILETQKQILELLKEK